MEKERNIRIGNIVGRHELPVDGYVLTEGRLDSFTKKDLLPLVEKGLDDLGLHELEWSYPYEDIYVDGYAYLSTFIEEKTVDLYITGLTILTLVIIEALHVRGYSVEVYCHDPRTDSYYSQGLFRRNDFGFVNKDTL